MNRALLEYLYTRKAAIAAEVDAKRNVVIDGSKCSECGLEPVVLRDRRANAALEGAQNEIDKILDFVWEPGQ